MSAERDRFVSNLRKRIVEAGVFAHPDPTFSVLAPPWNEQAFTAEITAKLSFALNVFGRYCRVRERCPRDDAGKPVRSDSDLDLLEIVKNSIENEIALVLRQPVMGVFDRREVIAETGSELLLEVKERRWQPESESSPPVEPLDEHELRNFVSWVEATVDAVLAEEQERLNLGIPESWPTSAHGRPERGTDRGGYFNSSR
jgi:hypothetical protein